MVTPLNSVRGLLIVASLWERPQAFVAAAPSVQAADEVCCPPEPPSCIVTRISELMCIHSPFPGGRTEPETCSPRTPTTPPAPHALFMSFFPQPFTPRFHRTCHLAFPTSFSFPDKGTAREKDMEQDSPGKGENLQWAAN